MVRRVANQSGKKIERLDADQPEIEDVNTYHNALITCILHYKDRKGNPQRIKELQSLKRQKIQDVDKNLGERFSGSGRQSRFHLTSILLLNSELREGGANQNFSPTNLFSLDLEGVNLFPLWLLYYIRERNWDAKKGVNFEKYMTISKKLKINEVDRIGLLKAMTRPDRRLVYSGVDDWQQLEENGRVNLKREFSLSWAGHGYIGKLVKSTCYIQWAFSQIESLQQHTGYSKTDYFPSYYSQLMPDLTVVPSHLADIFEAVIITLTVLMDEEDQLFRSIGHSARQHNEFRCGSPVSDIFTDVGGFISSIGLNQIKLSGEEGLTSLREKVSLAKEKIEMKNFTYASSYQKRNKQNFEKIVEFTR